MCVRYAVIVLVLLCLVTFTAPASAQAITITDDPQFVVMNFSTINELNWAAPEPEWQATIKPQILAQLDQLLAALPRGTKSRKLAWSTLMEYMNFPMDQPGPDSPYVIKTRRIFEIAEERDLPVFIPLNGFQWWDQLPELYNWWDSDGTHTPNNFFTRQKDPVAFKQRFIAGYNPANIWNVEWQDWNTPMMLNWRNWGGGGFRLAPPPNLVAHTHAGSSTYRQVMEGRFTAILNQIDQSVTALEQKNKGYLFAGISIGTEISLNASATAKDEFMPYGYRSIQDTVCPTADETCLNSLTHETADQLQVERTQVVAQYLFDLSRIANKLGIPKQRVYTHVWGESPPSDPKYAPYAPAAFNAYSRPGMSFYGFAEDPYASVSWQSAQLLNKNQPWGAVEYSLPANPTAASKSLHNLFDRDNSVPAQVVVLYNWSEHQHNPGLVSLKEFLNETPSESACELSDVIPTTAPLAEDPTTIAWSPLANGSQGKAESQELVVVKGIWQAPAEAAVTYALDTAATSFSTSTLAPGVYTWYVQTSGCEGSQLRQSQPEVLTISQPQPTAAPWWVNQVLLMMDKYSQQ